METAEIMEFHKRLGLHRETAAHVVVAIYHIVIVALLVPPNKIALRNTRCSRRDREPTRGKKISRQGRTKPPRICGKA